MPRPRRPLLRTSVLTVALLLAACTGDDDPPGATPDEGGGPGGGLTVDDAVRTPAGALPALGPVRVAGVGDRRVLVDDSGRHVLLRGATLNALADIPPVHPSLPPTRPATEQDWEQMAALGFDVVRVLVSWSALEPERGRVDDAYLERIRATVDQAAAHRIRTVVALHQEGFGPATQSPPGTTCGPLTEPAVGSTGAPVWATHVGDADTCRPLGDPSGAPAVRAALRALAEDRDGTRGALAATWGRLAGAVADHPALAGFTLLTGPVPLDDDPATSERLHTDLLRPLLGAVRAAEDGLGAPRHPVFVEPLTSFPGPGSLPAVDLALDDQLVLAPTLPVGRPGPGGADAVAVLDAASLAAAERGWPVWVASFGPPEVDQEGVDALVTATAAQDEARVGGAHRLWRRWCGDPASAPGPDAPPPGDQHQLTDVVCPDDVAVGVNAEVAPVAGRGRPRAAPGLLTAVRSDPAAGTVHVEGVIADDLASGGDLVLWLPGDEQPDLDGEGTGATTLTRVPGGWYASVEVTDSPYAVDAR